MHAFYHPTLSEGNNILSKEESHHMLKVMRLKQGAEFILLNGEGKSAEATLTKADKNIAHCAVEKITIHEKKSPLINLFIAPPKSGDRLDLIVEKAPELGVNSIHFLMCRNSERKHLKVDKIQQKVIAACKQSLQAYFPAVHDFIDIHKMELQPDHSNLIFHCREDIVRTEIEKVKLHSTINLFIGPEGDFAKEEIKMLLDKGGLSTSLSNSRLRTETAALSAIIKSETLYFI
ncbi:RsmE family RNA methyltransferase [Luteibaculum oceani]|uniref:Ribosomal RNA small subunit methyltransferase E n=1 Tax=Luteibaculum oceani TaxID=1294296 RepID=A0A5C6V8R4_9FLAO|nr:RsmE family RNA methyltransferase [Luteibaculum oceani]TXC81469.1 16S rRNA (uracil(1498)-N(3))-methyltransferase [Luteibaculum oceani]